MMAAARAPLPGLLAVAMVLFAMAGARGETLVTALSASNVSINSNFTGVSIVVFGVVERDAETVERPDPYDIIVVIRGPLETVVTRRKDRVVGVWVNNASTTFRGVPSFYALQATRKLEDIADPALLERRRIGAKYLDLSLVDTSEDAARAHEFRDALLRLKLQDGLYAKRAGAVEFLSPSLFRTAVPLPANVPVGNYRIEVTLLRGGAILAEQQQTLTIAKSGFEQWTYSLAYTNSLLYGLGAVIMALFTGWLAGLVFRRD